MKKLFLMAVWAMLAMPLFAQSWSKDLEKAAKNGDVEAQFTVGNAYLTGDGVKQNLKKATQWLFMAAQAGQADAIKTLCTYYSDALEQVAAAGNADAQFALANFYETGNGVAQNQAKALELYGSAAAQGIAEAKPKVLGSYNAGIVTLADAGDIDAATQVADYLFNGTGGATKDEAAAANYYAKAYMAGNKSAGTKLTTMYRAYLEGRGVPKNENLGYLWLAKAASAGIEEAKEKFYSTDSPYLVETAKSGDFEALKALAVLRGSSWFLRAIDECKDVNQLVQIYQIYDKDKMSVQWPYKDTQDKVIMHGINAVIYRAFALDDYLGPVNNRDGSTFYNFNDTNFDYNTIKIDSPDAAYFLIWNKYGSENQRHILVKRLINEFNHELAKKAYDEHYFQYDYKPYDIVNFDLPSGFEVPRVIIKGFTGLDNVAKVCYGKYGSGYDKFVEISSKKHKCEVPTSEELQMLIESVPDFAINQDAVRVIRGLTVGKDEKYRWIVDAFYLPGLIAYGPDSYVEIFDMGSKPGKLRFGSFATQDTGLKLNGTITGVETYTDKEIEEFGAKIKSITTIIRERTLQFKDWEILTKYNGYTHKTDKYYAVVDGDTVGISGIEYGYSQIDLVLEYYTVKGQDGIEFSLMPEESTRSIDSNILRSLGFNSGAGRWYRMTYPKPDGSKMDVLIPRIGISRVNCYEYKITFDKVKEYLNAVFLDSIFNEAEEAIVITETGEMIPYRKGILASEYNAQEEQRKEAEDNAIWEAFWEDMAKQYGKSHADLLRNSNQIVVKGLDIRVLIHYTAFMYEKWKTNVGAMKFYRQDADGYGVFILYRPTGEEIWIRTQNNKIYDWTLYGND